MFDPHENQPKDLPDRAAGSLMRVVPALFRVFRAILTDKFPLLSGFPQWRILLRLSAAPNLSLKDLADREGVTPPTMSKSVELLVEKGWVTRTASTGDRRSIHIALTPEGLALTERVVLEVRTQFAARLGTWEERSLLVLTEALALLEASSFFESYSEIESNHG